LDETPGLSAVLYGCETVSVPWKGETENRMFRGPYSRTLHRSSTVRAVNKRHMRQFACTACQRVTTPTETQNIQDTIPWSHRFWCAATHHRSDRAVTAMWSGPVMWPPTTVTVFAKVYEYSYASLNDGDMFWEMRR